MRKREAGDDLSRVPTLGDVAKETDFAPLLGLLETIKGRPVTELSNQLRAQLLEGEAKPTKLLLSSFFAACDARATAASLKRPHVGVDESAQGEHQCSSSFFLCSPFLFSSAPRRVHS